MTAFYDRYLNTIVFGMRPYVVGGNAWLALGL